MKTKIDYSIIGPKISELAASGMTAKAIADTLSLGRDAIDRFAKKNNISLKDGRGAGYRKEQFPCVICGILFHTKRSMYEKGTTTTCSKKCSSEVRSKANPNYAKVEITCQYCSKIFLVKPTKIGIAKFCSKKCMYRQKGLSEESICTILKGYKNVEDVMLLLPNHITIVKESFVAYMKSCRFVDSQYGEFTATPFGVIKNRESHNLRRLANMKKTKIQNGDWNILPNGQTVREYCEQFGACNTTANKIFRTEGSEVTQKWIENYSEYVTSLEVSMISILSDIGFNATKYDKEIAALSEKGFKYRPDFVLKKNNKLLYLDADGLLYHSDYKVKNGYHSVKRKAYESCGLRLMQFREDEIMYKRGIVASMIASYFGDYKLKIGARELELKKVQYRQAKSFLEENHLMGHSSAKHIGLFLGEELMCIMGFKGKEVMEIVRFATKMHTSVPGGFSRLLRKAIAESNCKEVFSHVDLRYATGYSLSQNGFVCVSEHIGFSWTDGKYKYNRRKCRANMDDRLLKEEQYAEELKWYKIYDAGQAKFIKILS